MPKDSKNLFDLLTGGAHFTHLPEETVHVAEWKRDVVLRGFSSRERDEFEVGNVKRATDAQGANGARRVGGLVEPDLTNFRARLVARHIVENGVRTFASTRGEEALGDQPATVLEKLFVISRRLSGFSDQDIEQLTKNSEPTGEKDPSTASPASSGGAPSVN